MDNKYFYKIEHGSLSEEDKVLLKIASEKIREKLIDLGFDKVEDGLAIFSYLNDARFPVIREVSEKSLKIGIEKLCEVEDYVNEHIRKQLKTQENN